MSITLELDLPEKLAAEAKANGLFESASLSGLLEDELRRRRSGQELIAALEDEIQARSTRSGKRAA